MEDLEKYFKLILKLQNIKFPTKSEFNILSIKSIEKYIKKNSTQTFNSCSWFIKTHGITHDKNIAESISKKYNWNIKYCYDLCKI